jgi:hypothetical protein
MEVTYVQQLKSAHFRQNEVAFWNLGQFLLLFAGQKEDKKLNSYLPRKMPSPAFQADGRHSVGELAPAIAASYLPRLFPMRHFVALSGLRSVSSHLRCSVRDDFLIAPLQGLVE